MTSVEPLKALNLDPSQQQSFVRFFQTLPDKPSTTIRIFNRSDYYTVHGEDAKLASKEVFKSTSAIKIMGTVPKVEYVVLSKNNFERLVRTLLLVKHYKVEVYNNQGNSKNNDWQIEFKGSPGNVTQFEDILFDNNEVVSGIIMSVKLQKNLLIGLSLINTDERIFSLCEFTDNEFFCQLESLIIQLNPRECLIHSNDQQNASRLKTILQRSNILCNIKKMEFCIENIQQDLNRLLYFEEGQQQSCNSFPEMNMETAMASLHAAIGYLELTADQVYHGKFKIQILDTKRYVHLDHAAVKALNILPKEGAKNKNTSIIGLLDNCRTIHGRRTLLQWIKQPLRDMNALTDRLDIVETFVNDLPLTHFLHGDHLRKVPDLLMLSKKIIRKKSKLQDIYKVYQTIDSLPNMVQVLAGAENKTINSYFVEPLKGFITDMDKFQRMIETTFDMDLVGQGEFLVKNEFDDDLKELSQKKKELQEKMQDQLNSAAHDLALESGKTIKLEYTDQLGYFFRITLKEELILRKNKQYKILGAVKGGVRFTSNKLEQLNTDYNEANQSYEKAQKSIVNEIQTISAGYADTLLNINYIIAQIDVLVSFANASVSAPKQYIRPKLLKEGSGRIKLIQVRHPLLELQDGVSFNPNDIELTNQETLNIITGPNMGGKSTYIRSIGVAVLMAHIGCFVPCDDAEISLVDSILARIGSEDCQSKGLSTFMLEMVETSGILRTATKNSLVVIDELGRGTSTYEGCGLAWAIAEYLAKDVKSFTLFATHFHEITALADDIPNVVNKYVTALISENSLTLMYQVKAGVCDQSFGLHVAKMAGFPDDFIQYASEIQHSLEDYRNIKELQDFDAETRQKFVQEGDKLILNRIDKFKELSRKRKNDEELVTLFKQFKEDILLTTNPYVKALLTK